MGRRLCHAGKAEQALFSSLGIPTMLRLLPVVDRSVDTFPVLLQVSMFQFIRSTYLTPAVLKR